MSDEPQKQTKIVTTMETMFAAHQRLEKAQKLLSEAAQELSALWLELDEIAWSDEMVKPEDGED